MNIRMNEQDAGRAGIPVSDSMKKLLDRREHLVEEARSALDRLADNASPSEVRRCEKRHDELMAEIDGIDERIDRETGLAVRSKMRPTSSEVIVARGVDDGAAEYGDSDPTEAFALRSRQSFESYIVERGAGEQGGALEFSRLSTGAYLRAMVTGPDNELEKRALAEGTDSAGGYTVPDILSARMIDRMRAASVAFRAGAQTVPLGSDVNYVAKVLTDPAPAWRMENAAVNESDPTFGRVTLTARSLAVMVKVSRELLEDSLNMETVLPQLLATALATELDRVALIGTGVAPQPRGVMNFAGLTTNSFAGGNLSSYAPLIAARTALRSANSDATAYIMHPRDEGTFAGLTSSVDAQPLMIPPALANVPMLTTTAVPTNLGTGTDESVILAGDWSRLMIGIRSNIRIEILRERYADNHQYAFVAHMRADVSAEHEAAFTVLDGITA